MGHPGSDRGQRCRCRFRRRGAQPARAATLLDDARGVLLIEAILVYVPVALFFFLTWQLGELAAADLVLARAATAAAREAVVVLPDDPRHYAGEAPLDAQAPRRRAAVEAAARSVLSAAPSFDVGSLELELVLVAGPAPDLVLLDTRLHADFRCSGGGLSLVVCGASSRRTLSAVARGVVHGARYAYSSERPNGRN
jgi:hypothetical protein